MDKTQYFTILKQLHDICRNLPMPKFTGMEAYNEIMNYLFLRHCSDNYDIPEEHNLKTLYDNYCTNEKIKEDMENIELNKTCSKSGIRKKVYAEELSEKLLPGLIDHNRNQNVSFLKIMGDNIEHFKVEVGRITNLLHNDNASTNIIDGGTKVQKLINKIYQEGFLPLNKEGKFNIELFPYDAVGEGFEKFMSDAGSTGGNWGQHFTNPQAISYVIDEAPPNEDDKIGDPFAGSGGIILQVKKKTKVKAKNIYAHENDHIIYKFLKFNSQIAKLKLENIMKGDTYDYTDYLKKYKGFFNRIYTNPPFGESVEILLSTPDKKEFWDIMKSGNYTIKESMGLAVWVIYQLLAPNGIASFVTDRGILNNGTEGKSWQKRLRKFLVENTAIKSILLLPKGIFSHTTFGTACVMFEKGKKTDNIVFHKGYFKDEDKGTSNKKMHIKRNVLTITLKDIVCKDFSLKYDDYVEKKDESKYDGIEYKTLGEVCEFIRGKALTIADMKGVDFQVIGGGVDLMDNFYSQSNTESNQIIMSNDGSYAGYLNRFNKKLFLTSHCNKCNITDKNINESYLFYYLKLLQHKLIIHENNGGFQKGQAQPSINIPKMYKEIKIPILPEDHQQRIVEYMDKTFGTDYKKLDKIVSKFKDYDLFRVLLNENYSDFDALLETYDDLIQAEGYYERLLGKYKNLLIQKCFRSVPCKMMKLGELVETSGGVKFKLSKQPIETPSKIAYLRGGDLDEYKTENFTGVYFDYEDNKFKDYIINKGDIYYTLVGTVGVCGEYLCDIKTIISGNLCRIYNCKINKNYLINYLVLNKPTANKNAQPNISRTILNNLLIPVPSPEDQEKVVHMIEKITAEDSDYTKSCKAQEQTIKDLYSCAEQLINSDVFNIIKDDNIETQTDDEIEEIEYKSKGKVKKNKKEEKPVEVSIKTKTKKSKNKEVQEIDI